MAPAKVSVDAARIHLKDPDVVPIHGKRAAISMQQIQCVLMKQYDLIKRRFYFVDADNVEGDAEGHLVIYQGATTRWELHFFRCDAEAGQVYQMLRKYLPPSVFAYRDENDYIASKDEQMQTADEKTDPIDADSLSDQRGIL